LNIEHRREEKEEEKRKRRGRGFTAKAQRSLRNAEEEELKVICY
jgi:hypothetical protein